MKKKCIFWEAIKYSPEGQKPTGKFRTKVDKPVRGAVRFVGKNEAGVSWDYLGLLYDTVSGRLKWIDKVEDKYSFAKLNVYIESDKYLHRVSFKYDAIPCRDLVNRLLGAGKGLLTDDITLSFWVREKRDKDEKVVMNDKGQPIFIENIIVKDLPKKFEDFNAYAKENGLEWEQKKDAKGKTSWDTGAELKFWDEKIALLQESLLLNGVALPFTYGSYICSSIVNPSGAANLKPELVEKAKEVWEKIRGDFDMPFHTARKSADDIDFDDLDTAYIPSQVEEKIAHDSVVNSFVDDTAFKAEMKKTDKELASLTNDFLVPDSVDSLPF